MTSLAAASSAAAAQRRRSPQAPLFQLRSSVCTSTSGGGDELYGVEPLSYYVKNLALNWNAVAVLGLLSLPLVLLSGGAQGAFSVSSSSSKSPSSSGIGWVLLPLYLWLAVVVPRPHKEERFLFPIYPILCAGAALVVDAAAGAGARCEVCVPDAAGLPCPLSLLRWSREKSCARA